MDYLLEPQDMDGQLCSLLDEEMAVILPPWSCDQGAPAPREEALNVPE